MTPRHDVSRWLAACGALLAALSVALAAYSAHAAAPGLQSAAWLGLVHGAAAVALAGTAPGRPGRAAVASFLAGAWLFAGSLATAHFLGLRPVAAPAGGMLMIAGWLLLAPACLRR
jgi:uncharacterized membrane protein YgdD (TMEM256/DUF423 family)